MDDLSPEEKIEFMQTPLGNVVNFILNLYIEDPEDSFRLSLMDKNSGKEYTITFDVEEHQSNSRYYH